MIQRYTFSYNPDNCLFLHRGERKRTGASSNPFSIALLHNLIFIHTRNQGKSGLFEVNLAGGVYEAHGEDFSFEPLCLPVHSAGSVQLHDSDFESALNQARSSFMTSYALEAYNSNTF